MPPNQNQENGAGAQPPAPAPVIYPYPSPGAAGQAPSPQPLDLPPAPAPAKSRKKLIIGAVIVAVAILIALGAVGYTYNQKRVANQKFNSLALDIKNQEKAGITQYVKLAGISNDLNNLTSAATSDNPPADLSSQTDAKLTSLKKIVDDSCGAKDSDLSGAKIDQRMAGLKLSAAQKQYVSDMKKVVNGLNQTDYSNTGVCSDGPAIVSLMQNFVAMLPGITVFSEIGDTPSAAQMNALKKFTTFDISDEADLTTKLPAADQLLRDFKSLISDAYYTFNALNEHNLPSALQYEGKVESLGDKLDTDEDNMTAEINSLDKIEDSAASQASLTEISAIDYQISHKSSNSDMQLDYALPAFRIADSAISDYSDNHNDTFPAGTSISDISGLNDDMKTLKNKNLLKNLTYTSLGADRSGGSLSAKLADGTTITERTDPSGQST